VGNWILAKSLTDNSEEELDCRVVAGDYAMSNRKMDNLNSGLRRYLKEDVKITVKYSDFNKIMGAVRDIERRVKKW
jgi:hypothetical protein